jgi:hypothetical protein
LLDTLFVRLALCLFIIPTYLLTFTGTFHLMVVIRLCLGFWYW